MVVRGNGFGGGDAVVVCGGGDVVNVARLVFGGLLVVEGY